MKIHLDMKDFHGIVVYDPASSILAALHNALARSRVVVLVGPRQSGKTTLARELLEEDSVNYFDLEDPASLARLDEPMTALRPLKGLVVIDEIQRRPDLFPVLRVLATEEAHRPGFSFLEVPPAISCARLRKALPVEWSVLSSADSRWLSWALKPSSSCG